MGFLFYCFFPTSAWWGHWLGNLRVHSTYVEKGEYEDLIDHSSFQTQIQPRRENPKHFSIKNPEWFNNCQSKVTKQQQVKTSRFPAPRPQLGLLEAFSQWRFLSDLWVLAWEAPKCCIRLLYRYSFEKSTPCFLRWLYFPDGPMLCF